MLGVNRLRLAFPVPSTARELLTFTGHHLRERAPQRHNFEQGFFSQESWIGRPGFSSGFLFCAGIPGFDFTHGTVYACIPHGAAIPDTLPNEPLIRMGYSVAKSYFIRERSSLTPAKATPLPDSLVPGERA